MQRFGRNGIVAVLFVLIALSSLLRADYPLAIAAIAIGISLLLFAPPTSRIKSIAAYAFTAIALLSILAWLYFAFSGSPALVR